MENPVFRALIWPGLMLQKLTTREPTDDQLEVALASLKVVLKAEKETAPAAREAEDRAEIQIGGLGELGHVAALVAEFPE